MDTVQEETAPGRRRLPQRQALLIAVPVAALSVVVTLVVVGHHGRHGPYAGPDPIRHSQVREGGFRAGDTGLVVLDGVSGKIRVAAARNTTAVSGTYDDDHGGGIRARLEAAAGRHTLRIRCSAGDGSDAPCAGALRLTVPQHTGLRLRQTSGETDLEGLGGPLTVDTASDRMTATGLRSSNAVITVVSGSADIAFARAPDSVALHATSASAALRLPSAGKDGAYAVTPTATSADVRIQVPHRAGAPHRVALDVVSGSLAVLPAM
ncbi:hypothetical protein [Streptomyces sp. NBC_00344]|uniref:hypothetical protein n=1 Tax=Streptomyces sp. NBC_00344 TaxID=2975720 RepID=UPI002E1D2401